MDARLQNFVNIASLTFSRIYHTLQSSMVKNAKYKFKIY